MIFNITKKNLYYVLGYTVLLFCLLLVISENVQAVEVKRQEQKKLIKNTLSDKKISEKLQLAEDNKRSHYIIFKKLISEINQQPYIKKTQQHSLDFLNAYDLLYRGQYDKAKPMFEALLQRNISNLMQFKTNYLLIYIATVTQNWRDGLQYIASNTKLLTRFPNGEPYQNNMLATIIFYNQIGQYQLALSYIDNLSKQELSAKNSCALLQLSLEAQFNLKKLKHTDSIFPQAINKCINADFIIAANFIRFYKAKLYLQVESPEKAVTLLSSLKEEVINTHYPMLIADMSNIFAEAYWQMSDIYNARKYATESLESNPNNANLIQAVDSYFLLYQIAKKQHDLALALEYFEKYSDIEKSSLEGEETKKLALQLAKHKNVEQESQIKLLNEKNNVLAAKQSLAETEVANRKLIIVALTLIIIALATLATRLCRDHKRVKELAEFDPLTGIFNRGHFTQVAHSALKYCQNSQQDLCVIMFDLDYFKRVNDSFGHACGDWALKETTKACESIGRKNDIFARIGGEEFCIVLPSCNIETAMSRAEDYRAIIEAIVTKASGYDFTLTASFGVTDVKRSGYELDQLLADADFAAYASKDDGRNRVSMFQAASDNETEKLDASWEYN
ncbi:GGDEF domain-containing protein [Colwellia demingiae]|uniref:diguanylate cyclase n=1 Tax=Colwellia demingiae TaxID=89401 RepID=A0A5C6Q7L0_9GAMM|nr:GGDEF domain-containing protein [Colwellia demingiae]